MLHWALHEIVSQDASQKGSFVGPDKLTFDFNSPPLTPQQVADIEKLVNERILENAPVSWTEVPYADIKSRGDIRQFFGEKYGDTVRVLQIGGERGKFNGYSMELCGGTHVRATGEIGLFRIVAENAIAAGVRRIEAVAGMEAYRKAAEELQLVKTLAGKMSSPVGELEKKIESLLAQQKELEKQLRAQAQKQAAETAKGLTARAQMSERHSGDHRKRGRRRRRHAPGDGQRIERPVQRCDRVGRRGERGGGAGRLGFARVHGEGPGGQDHPADCAGGGRQRRRQAGQCARRRERHEQAGRIAGQGADTVLDRPDFSSRVGATHQPGNFLLTSNPLAFYIYHE